MSCLALSELSDEQVDEMSRDLRKRLALFRITSLLDQLPSTAPDLPPAHVTPGVAVDGASHMESIA